jgi:hypothetical protein
MRFSNVDGHPAKYLRHGAGWAQIVRRDPELMSDKRSSGLEAHAKYARPDQRRTRMAPST